MRVYLAGVMQGSRTDLIVESQNYREQIGQALTSAIPGVDVIDPWSIFPGSPGYHDGQVRETLTAEFELVRQSDVLIAYLPHASMGTAIEMWLAYEAAKPIVVASPMTHNWIIRATANKVLPDLDSLIDYVRDGAFKALVAN